MSPTYNAPDLDPADYPQPKPFWKKKRFLLPLATALLGAIGIKSPEIVTGVVLIVSGHSQP